MCEVLFEVEIINRSCFGINKLLEVKLLVSLFTRSMPIVKPKVCYSDESGFRVFLITPSLLNFFEKLQNCHKKFCYTTILSGHLIFTWLDLKM